MTRRVPLLLAVALLAAVVSAPAQAAFPGLNGDIVFKRGGDVWLMHADGAGPTALTTGGGTFDPAIGPGGSRIAFTRGGDIWVMNSDGSGQTNLTPATDPVKQKPAWSPDGTRIAFSQIPPGERSFRIYVMNSDGSNPVQVTFQSSGDFDPAWSPDGTLIAYTRQNNSTDIWTVNPAQPGSESEYVTSPSFTEDQPTWAPDGSAVAFRTNHRQGGGDDIYKQVGRGGPGEPVTNNPAADSDPTWSPDGTRIAFATTRGGGSQIWHTSSNSSSDGLALNLSGTVRNDFTPDWATQGAGGQTAPPVMGETLNAVPVRGTVTVRVPVATAKAGAAGSSAFVPLEKATSLPVGSTFNTKKGTVKLTFAASRTTTATQTGKFRGGLFTTLQSSRNPLTELRLRGGGLSKCSRLPKGGAASARRRSRSLFSSARGRFRTRGRNSTATVRGTSWVQKDTCKGTLTRVTSGSVLVRDLTKRRNVRLKKGQKYLARPPKRG